MPDYDIAAYIWPSYHYGPRMEDVWPEKDGGWYTVRRATPRFPGHDMPKIPLLGYQDEADPEVMRQHVELALEHGVNVFIMDWYWYDNTPCFERQLNEGLLPAIEGTDMRFFLMWANHDATSLWDMHRDEQELRWSGQVDRATLEPMFDRVIEKYLGHPNYYRIDGKPVFSIFQYPNLMAGLGGLEQTNDAFGWMRRRCEEKGLGGLHLQAIGRKGGGGVEAGARLEESQEYATSRALDFDSATCYQFVQQARGEGDYVMWANEAMSYWPYFEQAYGTFYPHVSIGWDNTHRHPSMDKAVVNATPDAFEACLWRARQYVDAHPDQPPLITVNSWNEWTEGSYLLPDLRWGYRYLRAVRNVFADLT
ncbi:MAG: glycoside hydrolase family 99-like domain-containing protein [Candidatus Sumerlaeota bacterium]